MCFDVGRRHQATRTKRNPLRRPTRSESKTRQGQSADAAAQAGSFTKCYKKIRWREMLVSTRKNAARFHSHIGNSSFRRTTFEFDPRGWCPLWCSHTVDRIEKAGQPRRHGRISEATMVEALSRLRTFSHTNTQPPLCCARMLFGNEQVRGVFLFWPSREEKCPGSSFLSPVLGCRTLREST